MLVMISQPMNGRSEDEIKRERDRIVEKFDKLHIDVVDTLFQEEAEGFNHPGLFYLSKTIEKMGKVDAVYFTKDWQAARGCRIERQIAQEYGIKILDTDFLDEDIYAKAKTLYRGFDITDCDYDMNDHIPRID